MIGKISTPRGMMHINYDPSRASARGEVECICPICTPGRQSSHQKEKKLSVNILSDQWRCNHCGAGGKLLSDVPDRGNGERIAYLRRTLPMQSGPDGDATYMWNYLTVTRKISQAVALYLGIYVTRHKMVLKTVLDEKQKQQWEGKEANQICLAFPFILNGGAVNCQYRDYWKNFTMEYGADKIFYNIDSVKGKKKVLITEGMVDVASVYTAIGLETDWGVISVPNGVSISQTEKEIWEKTGEIEVISEVNLSYLTLCWPMLEHVDEFCFAGDCDAAGMKLRKCITRMILANKKLMSWVEWSQITRPDGKPCKDANDVLLTDPKMIEKCIATRRYAGKTSIRFAQDCKAEVISHYFNGLVMALKSGWTYFDYHFGMKAGDLAIFNGWQGSGKSSFVVNLMLAFAWNYNWKWLLWMPENYPESFVYEWLMEVLMNRSMNKDSAVKMTIPQIERALSWVHEHFFCIEMPEDEDMIYTPDQIRDIATRMIGMHGINGLLIDPWNSLLEDESYYKLGSHKWLEKQLTLQNGWSKKNGVATIILAHPITLDSKDRKGNDDGSFKHPTVYQIEGGKIWSAKADIYGTVHRPNFSDQEDNSTDVYIQKLKTSKLYGIPTGEKNPVRFTLDMTTGRYTTRDGKFAFDSSALLDDTKQIEIGF